MNNPIKIIHKFNIYFIIKFMYNFNWIIHIFNIRININYIIIYLKTRKYYLVEYIY